MFELFMMMLKTNLDKWFSVLWALLFKSHPGIFLKLTLTDCLASPPSEAYTGMGWGREKGGITPT